MITINPDVSIAGKEEQHIVQLNISKPIGKEDVAVRGVVHRATLNKESGEVVKIDRTIDLNTLGSELIAAGHVTAEDFQAAYGVIHNAIHAAASAQAQAEDDKAAEAAAQAAAAEAPAEEETPAEPEVPTEEPEGGE